MNRIFNFHVVSDSAWFEKVLLFLMSTHEMVSIETLEKYMHGSIAGSNLCHITVDDGDKSFYNNIYPVLKKYRVPASLFVSPKICEEGKNFWFQEIVNYERDELLKVISEVSKISLMILQQYKTETIFKTQCSRGMDEIIEQYRKRTNTSKKPPQNMTVSELLEVAESNLVSIGAHTVNHPILKNEPDDSSHYEIGNSVERLSVLLQNEVRYFAYPNGIRNLDFTEREERNLEKAGIQLAFTTEATNFLSSNHKFRIPRIGISDYEKMFLVKAKIKFGSNWGTLKRMNPNGEFRQRVKLNDLLKQPLH